MRKFGLTAWAVLLWTLFAGASFGNDLVFAVPGAPGATLRFVGYDDKGQQIFATLVSQQSAYSGAPHYVVRVEQRVLAGKRLARWCVSDGFQKWGPAKAAPNKTVCDDTPKMTNGVYTFEIAELWPARNSTAPAAIPSVARFTPAGVEVWWGPEGAVPQWTRFCRPDDPSRCLVRRDLVDASGAIMASLMLRSRPGSDIWMSQVRLPIGTLLNRPTIWQIDAGEAWNMGVSYCHGQWCVADALAPRTGIAMFKRGNKMTVEVVDRTLGPHTMTFGLDGFTKAFDGSPVADASEMQPESDSLLAEGWTQYCDGRACLYRTVVRSGGEDAMPATLVLRGPSNPTLAVGVPVGMNAEKGVMIDIPGVKTFRLPFGVCDLAVCISPQLTLDDQFYDDLLASSSLKITANDLTDATFTTEVDMTGLRELIEATR